MRVKSLILLIINTLVILVVTAVSLSFYFEFSKVLDKRILLHLRSIKTLKKIQLQRLVDKEWNEFNFEDIQLKNTKIKLPKEDFLADGIYDLTSFHPQNKTSIGLVKFKDSIRYLYIIPYKNIKQILHERTGMGSSGESYLVASDFRLRSQSRFFPEKTPYQIEVKTEGVINGLLNGKGEGIFADYRGIRVYSVYNKLNIGNLNWVILSEIDVEEIAVPLKKMRNRLFFLTFAIIIFSIVLSLFLTKIITDPIKKIHESILIMIKGNYNEKLSLKKSPKEIIEISDALNDLKLMLAGAVNFSTEIGNMDLISDYKPKSKYDLLGYSLVKMRNKLASYRNLEKEINLSNKRLLVDSLEKERARLARELHDGIGPLLTTIKLYIQNKIYSETHKKVMKTMIDTTINEVRQMTDILRPTSLDNFGIGTTLSTYITNTKKSINTKIIFEDLSKKRDSNINKELEINLFRIIQELINNSIKHAKASTIRISLTEFDDFLALFYFDDGIGFNINKVKKGSGMSNMKERVEIFSGTLKIESKPDSTIFEIEIPLKK